MLEQRLAEIEEEFNSDPDKVWNYLNEFDLLITSGGTNLYIICVDRYIPSRNSIKIKFIYSLSTDTLYLDSGEESPDRVLGYPRRQELDRLESNLNYQLFINNNI